MFVLDRFDNNIKYMFDKNLYYKICSKLKIEPADWAEECHLKEVHPTTNEMGFIKVNDKIYNFISCMWCREKELYRIYNNTPLTDGKQF
jgi:predicted nucleic-acid-binding Zn-ribbon protein